MNAEERNSRTEFLLTCDGMKSILRRTMLADYSRRENDAEHSWHLALTAMVLEPYLPEKTDMEKVLKMAAVHDLVELYAGDTFAYDEKGHVDKLDRETLAADKIFGMLPGEQGAAFRALWEEFDAAETPEARFANAADRFQPFLNNVATKGHTWRQYGPVRASQVHKRMDLVSEVLPGLKDWIDGVIDGAVRDGSLLGE